MSTRGIPIWLNKDFKVRMRFCVQDQADKRTLSVRLSSGLEAAGNRIKNTSGHASPAGIFQLEQVG